MPVQSTCSSRNSIRYPLAGRVAARGVQTRDLLFARKGVRSKVRFPRLPKCQLNIQSPSDASTERLNPVASGFSTLFGGWNCCTDKSTAGRQRTGSRTIGTKGVRLETSINRSIGARDSTKTYRQASSEAREEKRCFSSLLLPTWWVARPVISD